jgi:hypothetical protein
MKKPFLFLFLAATPFLAQATDIRINSGGVRIESPSSYRYGDRDKRGYYWDGKQWRDQGYWDKNHGKGKGNKDCPPGQAKKGNC